MEPGTRRSITASILFCIFTICSTCNARSIAAQSVTVRAGHYYGYITPLEGMKVGLLLIIVFFNLTRALGYEYHK